MSKNAEPNAGSLVLEIGADDDKMRAAIEDCAKRLEKFEAMYAGFSKRFEEMNAKISENEGLAKVTAAEKNLVKIRAEQKKQLVDLQGQRGKGNTDIRAKLAAEEAEKLEKQAEEKRKKAADRYKDFAVTVAATTYNIQTYVVAPLKGMLQGFAGVGDAMDKMTRRAQMPVAGLTALGFAAEQNGAKVEDVASALEHLNGMMDRARRGDIGAQEEIFRGAGLFYEDLEKLPIEERLLKIVDVIAKVGNAADRAEIARRMFGSGGEALLPMLKKGREGIAALTAEADKLGIPLSREDVENSQRLAREMSKIRGIVGGIRDTFMSTLAEPVTDFLKHGQKMLLKVREFIDENPVLVKTLAAVAAGIVGVTTAVSLGVPILSALCASLVSVMGIVKGVGMALTLFASPWLAIPALIAGTVTGFVMFTDAGKKTFGAVSEWTKWGLDALNDFFGDAIKLIQQGDFSGAFENIWLRCKKIFLSGTSYIQNQFQSVLDLAKSWLEPTYDFVTGTFTSLWDAVKETCGGAVNFICGTWNTLWDNAKRIFGGLWDTVTKNFWSLGDEIGAEQGNIGDMLVTGWYGILKTLTEIWYGFRKACAETIAGLKVTWSDYFTWAQKGFNEAFAKLSGESEASIKAVNRALDKENERYKLGIGNDLGRESDSIDAEKEASLNALRESTAKGMEDAKNKRGKRSEDTDIEIEKIDAQLAAARRKLEIDVKTPKEIELAAAMGTDKYSPGGDAPWLREHQQNTQTATLNSFQAVAGEGVTEDVKIRRLNEEMRDFLRTISEKVAW